jgi:hypothetical protein
VFIPQGKIDCTEELQRLRRHLLNRTPREFELLRKAGFYWAMRRVGKAFLLWKLANRAR